MIVFLYGPDDYRRHRRKSGIVADFIKKHSALGLGRFDGEANGVLDELSVFVRGGALFESAKLAVLDNALEKLDPGKLAQALKPIVGVKTATVLISERSKPVKALAFLLKEPVRVERIDDLEGAKWESFVKAEAKRLGAALAPDAVRFLAAIYQGDSWGLITELQKLSALAAEGVPVSKKDLDALGLESAPNYWALVNGMRSYDGRVRLSALETLFSVDDPPPKIFNILAAQAGDKIPRMAGYDIAVKSGKLDYEEALLELALG